MERSDAYERVKAWMKAGYTRQAAIHKTAKECGMSSAVFGLWLSEGRKQKSALKQREEGQLSLF